MNLMQISQVSSSTHSWSEGQMELTLRKYHCDRGIPTKTLEKLAMPVELALLGI
jgi:hypothetical protein